MICFFIKQESLPEQRLELLIVIRGFICNNCLTILFADNKIGY